MAWFDLAGERKKRWLEEEGGREREMGGRSKQVVEMEGEREGREEGREPGVRRGRTEVQR